MLNILIVGNGQCGNRILDAVNKQAFAGKSRFSKFYSQQKFKGRVETIAVNTAKNDLKELNYTKAKDRVHIPHLHGVGANRNVGKKVFSENKDLIMRHIEDKGTFDVAFVITSASGGTGSSKKHMISPYMHLWSCHLEKRDPSTSITQRFLCGKYAKAGRTE